MSLRFLCAADTHLGKTHLFPKELEHLQPVVVTAWKRMIDMATSKKWGIDALLIAGDLIVTNDLFFDLLPLLKESVAQLEVAQVPLIAIAGNHDCTVTEKLWRAVDSKWFRLLGSQGEWERTEICVRGQKVVFDGWSFPKEHVEESPFSSYALPEVEEVQIGLMHGDCFDPESRYAPFTLDEMRALPHAAWVCGHIHKPEVMLESPLVFYTGALQGLDPSERDAHGVHILEISSSMEVKRTFHPLAVLEWKEVVLHSEKSWEEGLHDAFKEVKKDLAEGTRAVACRLRYEGSEEPVLEDEFVYEEGGCFFFIEKVLRKGREHGLEGEDLIGMLSQELEREEMLEEARAFLEKKLRGQEYVDEERKLSDEELSSLLRTLCDQLQRELLEQKEGSA